MLTLSLLLSLLADDAGRVMWYAPSRQTDVWVLPTRFWKRLERKRKQIPHVYHSCRREILRCEDYFP